MLNSVTKTAFGAMLLLGVGSATPTLADYIKHEKLETGDHLHKIYDDKGKLKSIHLYDKNYKHISSWFYSNPNPGDDGSSGATENSQAVKEALQKAMRQGGGTVFYEKDFFETPFGKQLVETGKTGSIVPFHNPSDALTRDFESYGSGKGGIDLNGGSISEQIKQNASKSKDDDDDDDDNKSSAGVNDDALEWGGASVSKELVNPVPLDKAALKSRKKKVQIAPATALTKKLKKRRRNVVTRNRRFRTTTKFYPTIPNLPRAALKTHSRTMQGMRAARRKMR